MITTTIRSVPAIVGGTIAAGIAWASITRGLGFAELTLEHAQAAGLIGLSILASHLAGQARLTSHRLAAVALVVASFVGSILTVYNGIGSRAETRDVKVAAAELSTSERIRIEADLAKTNRLVAEAESWVGNECKSGKGTKCDGVTFVLNQRKASQASLQGQLKQVGPVTPPEPKAAQAGLLAGLMGFNAKTVQAIVSALDPLSAPLFFEVMAILLWTRGLGHQARPVVIATPTVEAASDDVEPLPPARMPTQSEVIQWRTAFVQANGRLPRGKELQAAFEGIPKTSAWRYANCKTDPRDESKIRRVA